MLLCIDSFIDSFIAGKIYIIMFICSFMFFCIDSFNNSFIAHKTMENLRKQCMGDLVTSEEKLKKLAAQPSFKKFEIFNENLAALERAKVELKLNQPIYLGFAILDLLKTLIYNFHYSKIKKKYPNSTLLFADTDSITYQVQTDNLYEDFSADKHLFIFYNYEKKSPFYYDEKKKVIGKIKDM